MLSILMPAVTDAVTCRESESYCNCWNVINGLAKQTVICDCAEGEGDNEWNWEKPSPSMVTSVAVEVASRQVKFHPYYSTGTAAIRGDTPFRTGYHYYWEVKMLTDTYGTDIMVGLGSEKVSIQSLQFKYNSLLGADNESYGLSYRGWVCHDGKVARLSKGFRKGSIIGVKLDLWKGTMEFFVNREPQGISFYNLRRHGALYPMLCSTAAHSSMRLIYTCSWRASLFLDAAKVLADRGTDITSLPPGLRGKLAFWMTTPTLGVRNEEIPKNMFLNDNSIRLQSRASSDRSALFHSVNSLNIRRMLSENL